MRGNLIVAIIVIVIIILGASIAYFVYQRQIGTQNQFPSPAPSPISNFPSDSSDEELAEGVVPSIQPESGTNTNNVNLGINVTSPQNQAVISSPVTVKGFANVEDESLSIEVKDSYGNILGEGTATACFDTNLCPFEASVVFNQSSTDEGTVEVSSPQSSDYLQAISIRFL